MRKRNFNRLFDSRKSHLDSRIKLDYIKNGIATVHCCISSYNDIISTYSAKAKNQETLNFDFVEYLKSATKVIPDEYPIVLNIIGDCLTDDEKKIITGVIRDDFAYELGEVEKDHDREYKLFLLMVVGSIVAGILRWLTNFLDEVPREFFIVLFWFFGDRLFEYIFITGRDLRQERRLAGRLASIKVIFSDTYEEPNYTEDEINRLYAEIDVEQ